MNQRYTNISRTLSYFLRHGAKKHRLTMSKDGYIKISDLLAQKRLRDLDCTLEDVQYATDNNDKSRFQIKTQDGVKYIRATQGHSLQIESEGLGWKVITLDDLASYPVVVHGTFLEAWPSISRTGLKKMGRTHIHFAKSDPGTTKAGYRHNAELWIYIDLAKALQDGIPFYESDNGVVLSAGVDGVLATKYFSRIVSKDGQEITLP
eukprot:TRINITY_DN6649_c0_g1_i2.p1 TRINITY_DN6649_c0_g1~~TRINITY_DN6649_c0_g1_i2.p1  ORF type:complete len:218 (-),score=35.19 TRINITY_DN6649_c0_g1_i2:333-950(-)